MNCPWEAATPGQPGGRYAYPAGDAVLPTPTSRAGDYVTLRAEQQTVRVALSTCPSGDCSGTITAGAVLRAPLPTDRIVPRQCTRRPPTEVHYELLD